MNGASTWLDELEARLEQRLEAFLRANPQQEALLAEQALRDQQERLLAERLQLRQEAELQRQGLLRLAREIRQWKERVERARSAGAEDLARKAEAHIATLMEQGRSRWQTLGELGERFLTVERNLAELTARSTGSSGRRPPPANGAHSPAVDLERAWASFETQQELEELRRRSRG